MAETNPIARIDGISKRFGKAVALQHLALDIEQGQFVTFLGPSGCGKSTTLKMINRCAFWAASRHRTPAA